MKDLVYIEKTQFRIISDETEKGIFFLLRKVWSYSTFGGHWILSALFLTFQILISVVAICLDLALLISEYLIIKLFYHILKGIFDAIIYVLKSLFGSFAKRSGGITGILFIIFFIDLKTHSTNFS